MRTKRKFCTIIRQIFVKKAKAFTQRREGAKISQRKSLRVLCVSASLRALFFLIPTRWGWVVIAGMLTIFAMGCASTTAPSKWLAPPAETQCLAYGGWISINYQNNRTKSEVHGELIAVHPDSVFVLTVNQLWAIPSNKISKAKLTAYDAQIGSLTAWSVFGTLSTLSHGIVLIISAPVWIISGTAATSAQSYAPQLSFPKKPWNEFRKYARFPSGLPPKIDRRTLQRK